MTQFRASVRFNLLRTLASLFLGCTLALPALATPNLASTRNELEHAVREALRSGTNPAGALAELRALEARSPKAHARGIVRATERADGFSAAIAQLRQSAASGSTIDAVAWSAAESRLHGEVALLRAAMAEDRERVNTLKLNATMQARVDAAQAGFEARVRPLLDQVAAVTAAQANGKRTSAPTDLLLTLDTMLETAPLRMLGVRGLPNRRLSFAPRALPSTVATPASFANPNATPPLPEDYAAESSQLAEDVLAKASELGHDYAAIHDFVRGSIRTEWYAGARRTPSQTLQLRAGNDAEQAALLIALLRASGAAARYVHGVVELPRPMLASITGLDAATDIGRLLSSAGVAHEPVFTSGTVTAFRVEQVFVSAYLPYANYRGSTHDLSGKTWIPLAPALKPHLTRAGTDLAAASALDVDAFIAESIANSSNEELPMQRLRAHLEAWLVGQGGATLESRARSRQVDAPALGLLPSSLPGRLLGIVSETAGLTDAQLQHVNVRIFRDASPDAELDREINIAIRDLADQRLTLSFQAATPADQDVIHRYGGLAMTPAYLVRLRARLMRDGEPVLISTTDLMPGDALRVEFELESSGGSTRTEQTVIAGGYVAIDLDTRLITPPAASSAAVGSSDGEFLAAELLANLARRYQQQWQQDESMLADWSALERVRPLPSLVLVSIENEIERVLDLPRRLSFRGVSVDAALRPMEVIAEGANTASEVRFMRLNALHGSALEHWVFENEWSVPAISTTRGLQIATDAGIAVIDQTGGTLPPTVELPAAIETEINAQLAQGLQVQVAAREVTKDSWQGAIWRAGDPETGDSGYFIAGGYAGGASTAAPEDWLLQFLIGALGTPNSPAPNLDPESAYFIDVVDTTNGQLALVDTALDHPLAVRVTDRDFRPVQEARVRFRVTFGNGKIGVGATEVDVVTDAFGVARVIATPAAKIESHVQVFLAIGDRSPNRIALNLVKAELLSGVRNPRPLSQPIKFYGKPGPVVRLMSVQDPFTVPSPGAWAGYWLIRSVDAHDNPVFNVDISYSSTLRMAGGASVPPHFYVASNCNVESPLLSDCGQPTLTSPTSIYGDDDVEVIAADGELVNNLNAVIYDLHASAANLEPLTRTLNAPLYREVYDDPFDTAVNYHYYEPWMARLGETSSVQSSVSFFRFYSTMPSTRRWNPIDPGPYSISMGGAGTLEIDSSGAASGIFNLRFTAGAVAAYAPLDVVHHTSAENPAKPKLKVESQFPGAFAIEFELDSVTPARIELGPEGFPLAPIEVAVRWVRPMNRHFPIRPTVVVERDGETVLFYRAGELDRDGGASGISSIELPNSVRFDPERVYTAHVILHDHSPTALTTAKFPLRFGREVLAGYDLVKPGTLGPRGAEGRFPSELEVRAHFVPTEQTCVEPQELAFTVHVESDVTVKLRRLLPNGNPSAFANELFSGTVPKGTTAFEFHPNELPIGSYHVELEAIDRATGDIDTAKADIENAPLQLDGVPLAHAMLKGVDLQNGHLTVSRADIALGGRGPALALTRTYSSGSKAFGAFGRSWNSDLDSRVIEACGLAVVIGADGGAQRFERIGTDADGTAQFRPRAGYHGTLTQRDNQYDFHAIDGTHYAFPVHGRSGYRLSRVTDPNGNWIEYVYDAPDFDDEVRVLSMRSKSGRELTMHWRRYDLLHQVIDHVEGPGGLRVNYAYDEYGYLISAERVGAGACAPTLCETYDYTDSGSYVIGGSGPESDHIVFLLGLSLTAITQKADSSVRTFEYDPIVTHIEWQGGGGVLSELPGVAVKKLTEADNSSWTFDYEALQLGQTDSTTTVTDGRSNTTTYLLNAYGAAKTVTDAAGSTSTVWDFDHYKPESVTDAAGATTTYSYDDHGNTVEEKLAHPSGTQIRSWAFFPPAQFVVPIKNRASTYVDARSIGEAMTYNSTGNLTSRSRGGKSEGFDYASNGDASSSTDFNGKTTTRTFDVHGYLASSTDGTGATTLQSQDVRGRLQSQIDANGNTTGFSHDAADRLVETRHPATAAGAAVERSVYSDAARTRTDTDGNHGETLTTHDPLGRVLSVRNAAGDTRTMGYDGNGNLKTSTDFRGNVTTYGYDGANRLTSKSEPEGKVTGYTHDALGHVLTETISGPLSTQRLTTYAYAHPRYARTLVSRAGGSSGTATESYGLDAHGNALTTTNANADVTTRSFDAFDRATSESFGGVATTHAYDGNGNRLSSTQGSVTRSWTYDAANRETSASDGNGKVSTTSYYPNGAVKERKDALGSIVADAIDGRSQVTARSGPRGDQTVSFGYDLNGNRVGETLANGRAIAHSYDEMNRRLSSSDGLGVFDAVEYDADGYVEKTTDGSGHATTFVVNGLGYATAAQAPLGRNRAFTYSVHGELISETSPLGKVTSHAYDGLGQRVLTTLPGDANAQPLVWTYDGLGNVLTSSDGNGNVTTHTYDARSRKESTAIAAAGDGGGTESFGYNDQDDLVSHTDRRGIAHVYGYDKEHRATSYQRAGVTQWTREHDPVGNVVTETDANGHTTTSTFDAANQRKSSTRAGQTRSWTYTPTNQVETQTDAGGSITRNTYNERDQLLSSTNGANETTTFTVDGDGLQRTRSLGGALWTNTFDEAHRLTGVESPQAYETIYGYDSDDGLASITAANTHTTTVNTDSQGRITSRTYPGGATFGTVFDGNGNALNDTTPKHSYTRTFDALNRLRTESSGSLTRAQTFDGNGNRLSASLSGGVVRTQGYDAHNRPLTDTLQTTGSNYSLSATRDANGNRTLSSDARNIGVAHAFDAHNRLFSSSSVEGATTNTWNPDGTLARIIQANGHLVDYSYDGAKRVTGITHRANGAVTLEFVYGYDNRGNRTTESRTEAALPGQAARVQHTVHGYDADDRLLSSTITHLPPNAQTPDTRTVWTLDGVGNRLTETVTALATNTPLSNKTYTYNARDQLEQIIDPTNDLEVDYGYDANGNRDQRIVKINGVVTSQVDYSFDARDRLIQAQPNAPNQQNEPIVDYRYDADDRRIARIETPRINGTPQPPITTLYVFDNSSLLHEATATGITDTYRRSAKLDRHINHTTNQTRHYQLDALDTPVAMTDATGATVNATTFDAWGNPTQQTAAGTTTVPWQVPSYNPLTTGQAALLNNDGQSIGFTGYQKDTTTGLYYAGARFYDPLIGGFNGMDPAWGTATQPVTFHKYLYANGNPIMYVDSDGRAGFLTTLRNKFDDADTYFRLTAEQNPSLAQPIGMARGLASLVGGGVRGVNLASDGVASLLDESYYGDVAAEGRRELSEALDPAFRYAERYAADPVKTAMQTNVAVIVAVANTTAAAARRDGGAISDIFSGATQVLVPALAARAGLVSAVGEVAAPARVIDDVVPDTSVAARTEISVESTVGNVSNSARPLVRPVQRNEVMTYEDSTSRAVTGDNLTGDHVPTIAAIRQNVEATLGQKLTRAQASALRNNTHVVVIDQDLHAAGRTYFNANTRSQIAQDACDLSAAACRDQATHLRNAPGLGYSVSELQAAFDALNARNAALFDQLSTKQGIKEFFEKAGL